MAKLTNENLKELGLAAESLPRHVAIIMDGNGRWAQKRGLPRPVGHRAGTERLRELIRFSSDAGIEALTLYAFSTENWKRPAEEKSVLFGLLIEYFNREIDELHENKVRISIWGEKAPFPENVRRALEKAEERTKDNQGLKLNICLNYGSRDEIMRVARLCAQEAMDTGNLPEQGDFEKHLYSYGTPEVDLLIRTSGEERVSNFLLYQLAYSEMVFTPVLWPDFTKEEYIKALIEYAHRGRRFGGV